MFRFFKRLRISTPKNMDKSIIVCPKCQNKISLDEALSHDLDEKFQVKLEEEKRKLWKIAQVKAEEKITAKLGQEAKELKEELEEKNKLIDEARKFESELRKKTRELEEEKKSFEIEKQRQMDAEREKIMEEAARQMIEEHRLKDAEKDKKMSDMSKMIEELKLKASLTSQQLQGEVFELELEELLRREFPIDFIDPVGKGVRGGDVLQIVKDNIGRESGKIIWESKRTKTFEDGWVGKLKEDMRDAKADVAVIVSVVLPKDVKYFSQKDGVYLTSFECVLQVAQILRKGLIELSQTKALQVGKNEKIESLYRYITSSEFAQKIDSMMETYLSMQKTLEKEKLALQKIWAQREKEIDRLKTSTLTIHGSLSGLIDEPMPQVKSLEFSEIDILLDD